jgi:protein-L-isoaspartate(D-aspartate) O-methyltransferase
MLLLPFSAAAAARILAMALAAGPAAMTLLAAGGQAPGPSPTQATTEADPEEGPEAGLQASTPDPMKARQAERDNMVEQQVAARGIHDLRLLDALRAVPRHLFVPERGRSRAYEDRPLPIGHGQTISQPYIVALMTELARVKPGDRVLEIGTGSGYQAAVLAALGCQVFTIEIVKPLADRAAADLTALGYKSVTVRAGDGYVGWPEEAPFDAILVTAAPPRIPAPLLEQLGEDGHLVVPIGEDLQHLTVVRRTRDGLERRVVLPVRFVPMTGAVRRIEQKP